MKGGGKCHSPGCQNEQHKKYRVCDPCRNSKRRYGLTVPDRDALLASQDNKCLICKRVIQFEKDWRQWRSAVVDHSHVTGKVRGILCRLCNSTLGLIEAYDEETREYLLEYIKNGP